MFIFGRKKMTQKYVVGYDGSETSQRALDFALDRARTRGVGLIVAHVLEWSPYTFLTPVELEERHKRRTEELARADEAVLAPALARLASDDVSIETVIKYGHIADTLGKIASETGAVQIFVGRDGGSGLATRFFGSVASSLAQSSPVPVTIVP